MMGQARARIHSCRTQIVLISYYNVPSKLFLIQIMNIRSK